MAKKSANKLGTARRKKWLTLLTQSVELQDVGSLPNKFVFDTNVLISAFFYGGVPGLILEHALRQKSLITSFYIIDELSRYAKKTRPTTPQKWLKAIRQRLELLTQDDTAMPLEPVRDINDTPVVALAITQSAVLVTGDPDLLQYKGDSRAVIISVRDYAELFL